MAVTPDVDYVTIAAVLGAMVGDATDSDSNPDWSTATAGTVTFTPTVSRVDVTDTSATKNKTVAMVPFPIVCTIDSQGRLTYNGDQSVTVLDLGSDKVNPSVPRGKAAYNVTFKSVKMDDATVNIDAFGINPSAADDIDGDGIIDLWDIAPLPTGSGGAAIARGQGVPSVTEASSGDVVTYDGTEVKWAAPTGGGASDLSDLSDVNLSTAPTDGQALVYDDDSSKWVPGTVSTGSVTSDSITDATTVGKSVLTATDAAAARSATGAKADSWKPASADISDATSVGQSVLTAADKTAARSAIGAGTSDLALGTTSTTALAGNTEIPSTAADVGAAPATTGTSVLKGDGAGGTEAATAGTDYVAPSGLATVATSGSYSDLDDKPSIPSTAADVGAVPDTRTVNGKALSADISLSASDVSAVPTTRTVAGHALSADVTLDASDVSAVPTTRTVNGNALSSDVTLDASDVGAAPYSLASGADGIRFIGAGDTLPASATTGDVFLKTS